MGLDGWKKIDPEAQVKAIEKVRDGHRADRNETRSNEKDLGAKLADLKKGREGSEVSPKGKEGKKGEGAEAKRGADSRATVREGVSKGAEKGTSHLKTPHTTGTTAPKGEAHVADQAKPDANAIPKNFDSSTQQKLEAQQNPHRSSFVPQTETPKLVGEMLGKYVPPTPPEGKEGEKTKVKEAPRQMQDAAKLANDKGPKGPVAPPPAAGEGGKLADTRLKEKKGDGEADKKDSKKSSNGKGAQRTAGGRGVAQARSGELGAAAGGLASDGEAVQAEERPVSYAINLESRMDVQRNEVWTRSNEYRRLEKRIPFDPEAAMVLLERAKEVDERAANVLRAYGLYGGITG